MKLFIGLLLNIVLCAVSVSHDYKFHILQWCYYHQNSIWKIALQLLYSPQTIAANGRYSPCWQFRFLIKKSTIKVYFSRFRRNFIIFILWWNSKTFVILWNGRILRSHFLYVRKLLCCTTNFLADEFFNSARNAWSNKMSLHEKIIQFDPTNSEIVETHFDHRMQCVWQLVFT